MKAPPARIKTEEEALPESDLPWGLPGGHLVIGIQSAGGRCWVVGVRPAGVLPLRLIGIPRHKLFSLLVINISVQLLTRGLRSPRSSYSIVTQQSK
jgi:hypothetical protein